MADVFTPEQRSALMARIRGRDTRPELVVRSLLHRQGYRFTVRAPNNRSLPGRPDLVLPKHRCVVFVHGCFWHGHEHCPDFRLPKSRRGQRRRRPGPREFSVNMISVTKRVCSTETEGKDIANKGRVGQKDLILSPVS